MLAEVLEEGTARAFAGDPGMAQNGSDTSYAAPFNEAEEGINFTEPTTLVRRKIAALNIVRPRARADLAGRQAVILDLLPAESDEHGASGSVVARRPDGVTVRTADQALRLIVDVADRSSDRQG